MGEREPQDPIAPREKDALSAAERQFAEAATSGDQARIVEAGIRLASEYEFAGRPGEGIALLQELRGSQGHLLGDSDLAELEASIATTLLFSQQEAEASLPWLEEALRLFDRAASPLRSAGMSYNLGVAHLVLGEYGHSLNDFERAVASFSEGGAEGDACDCQVGAALALAASGDYVSANRWLSIAQEASHRLEDRCRTARYLIRLVRYVEWSGAVETVYWALDEAADLAEVSAAMASSPDGIEEANNVRLEAVAKAGDSAVRQGDYERVEKYALRLLSSHDQEADALAWSIRGGALHVQGRFEQAVDARRKACDLNPDSLNKSRLENALGMAALNKGELDEAERRFTFAVEFAEGVADESLLATLRSDLALTWIERGEAWRAIPVFQSLSETASNPILKAIAHNNLAVALSQGGDAKGALQHLERAVSLFGMGSSAGLTAAAQLALRLAEDEESQERAREIFGTALRCMKEYPGSPPTAAWIFLAGAAEELEPRRVEEILDRAERNAKRNGETVALARIKYIRGEALSTSGRMRRARANLLEAERLLSSGNHDLRVLIDLELALVAIQRAERRLVNRRGRARNLAEAADRALPALLVSEMLVRANPNQRMRLVENGAGELARFLARLALAASADFDGLGELIEFFHAIGHPAPPSDSPTAMRRALRTLAGALDRPGVLNAEVQAPSDLTTAPALSAAFIDVLDDDDDTPLAPVPRVRMPSGRIALERYAKLAEERYGVRPFGDTVIAIADTSPRDDT